jgi:hypothetical protein
MKYDNDIHLSKDFMITAIFQNSLIDSLQVKNELFILAQFVKEILITELTQIKYDDEMDDQCDSDDDLEGHQNPNEAEEE